MPLRYLLDEHFRGLLGRALLKHNARGVDAIDFTRVGDPQDLALGTLDPAILLWMEREGRILVSHDKSTLPAHLADHLQAGHRCPGIFMVRRGSKLPQIIGFLALAAYESNPIEWQDRIEYIG